jgi:peptidoglycan hydrolase FlgJ
LFRQYDGKETERDEAVAISPPGDIVLDVMRAASPDKAQAARAQLQRLAQLAKTTDSSFTAEPAVGAPRAAAGADNAFQKFEAMVLGTFFQSMLPSDSSAVYGEGLAGDMWKSILAQHLGEAVSERGGIGIANRLLADRYREGENVVPLAGASDGPQRAALDTQNSLSQALVQELQRQTAQSLISDNAVPRKSGT